MSLDQIKSLLLERQECAKEYQMLHANVESLINAKITEAGIMDEIQSLHASREQERIRLQAKADTLSEVVKTLMESSGVTHEELRESFAADGITLA